MSERAREAAARAIHDRYEQITHWVKTLGKEPRPMETSGIKDIHRLDANAAIDAFLAALKADGYKLVRREASYEMTDAGVARLGKDRDNIGCTTTRWLWESMWDAAPEALTEVKS